VLLVRCSCDDNSILLFVLADKLCSLIFYLAGISISYVPFVKRVRNTWLRKIPLNSVYIRYDNNNILLRKNETTFLAKQN